MVCHGVQGHGDGPAARAMRPPPADLSQHVTAHTQGELWWWIFMRISGIVLLVLAVGHVLIMHVAGSGIDRVDFGFVAVRWQHPFWRLNAKDDLDYTSLHGAAYVGDNDAIQYLVSKGANPKVRASGRLGGIFGAERVAEGSGDTVADMANGPREKSLLHPESVLVRRSTLEDVFLRLTGRTLID